MDEGVSLGSQWRENLKYHNVIFVNTKNQFYVTSFFLKSRSAALFFFLFWFTQSNGIERILQSILDKPFLRLCECSLQLVRQRVLLVLTKWKQFHFIWIGNYRGLCLNFMLKRKPHPTQAIKINFQNIYTPNEILQYMCISEFTHPIVLYFFNSYYFYIAKLIARHMTEDYYKIIPVFL